MADLYEASVVLADRHWSLSAVPDLVIQVDEAKLRGALLNLIDNAVKATTTGDSIALMAEVEDGQLALTVSDTGVGIPSELHDAVFERFRRGDQSGQKGSGLGLAIVKAVADGHGGRCRLVSRSSEGTAISIMLPLVDLRSQGDNR